MEDDQPNEQFPGLESHEEPENAPDDPTQEKAKEQKKQLFDKKPKSVFYSRQLPIRYERDYFHWVTNRAWSSLVEDGELVSEERA